MPTRAVAPPRRRAAPAATTAPATPEWFVPLDEMVGVRPTSARRLSEAAIAYCEQVVALGPFGVEALTKLPAPAAAALWAQARFRSQGPLGRRFASALVAGGMASLGDIVDAPTTRLLGQLGPAADESTATQLQLEAARAAMQGVVALRIIDGQTGKPIPRGRLALGATSTTAWSITSTRRGNSAGRFAPLHLAASRTHLGAVRAAGYMSAPVQLVPAAGSVTFVDIALIPGADELEVDEFRGERLGVRSPGTLSRPVRIRRLADLPAMPPFRVSAVTARELTLVSQWRRLRGPIVEVPYITIPVAQAPARVQQGDFLIRDGRTWRKARAAEVSRIRLERSGLPANLNARLTGEQ